MSVVPGLRHRSSFPTSLTEHKVVLPRHWPSTKTLALLPVLWVSFECPMASWISLGSKCNRPNQESAQFSWQRMDARTRILNPHVLPMHALLQKIMPSQRQSHRLMHTVCNTKTIKFQSYKTIFSHMRWKSHIENHHALKQILGDATL